MSTRRSRRSIPDSPRCGSLQQYRNTLGNVYSVEGSKPIGYHIVATFLSAKHSRSNSCFVWIKLKISDENAIKSKNIKMVYMTLVATKKKLGQISEVTKFSLAIGQYLRHLLQQNQNVWCAWHVLPTNLTYANNKSAFDLLTLKFGKMPKL